MSAPSAAVATPRPSARIVDTQSVKTTAVGCDRGFDGGMKGSGRERHRLAGAERRFPASGSSGPTMPARTRPPPG
jgi:hypothetical protein